MSMIGMSRVCGSFLRVRTGYQRSTTGVYREDFEIADPLKAHLEHVEVVVVVIDV
jgi:hypothetical protein